MWKRGFRWIFLIVGTTIGAGYASGRELWQFFGYESSLAIILFGFLFTTCCFVILNISYTHQTRHYRPVLEIIVGKRLTSMFDLMLFFYLFTITVVMIAGSGVTGQVFGYSYSLGIVLIVVALIVLFMRGIHGLILLNGWMVPLLIMGLLYTLFLFMYEYRIPFLNLLEKQSNWHASFPFTSLLIVPLIAVLGAVGSEIRSRQEIWIASIGSGWILTMITYIYNVNLTSVAEQIASTDIPLYIFLHQKPLILIICMTFLLWFAIFSTAASSLLGLATRLQAIYPVKFIYIVVFLLIVMIPLTNFGFASLVDTMYPLYGLLNLYVLARLMTYSLWKK